VREESANLDMTGLNVWVVCGGPSGEAEVSRTSGRGVAQALKAGGHHVKLVEFEPRMAELLLAERPDVIFPVTHGTLGEDGCLQGMLEVFDVPYVGCGVLASAIGASKPVAKSIWRSLGLPVAREFVIRRTDPLDLAAMRIRREFGGTVVVKPASGGSSIGVERVTADAGEGRLVECLATVLSLDEEALVEPWLVGHEVTCGVLEGEHGLQSLPPMLIVPGRAEHYDFSSKYVPGGSKHVCPAPFSKAIVDRISELALLTHRAIGGRDLSRTDFIVDEQREPSEGVTILEINTLPGMTPVSLFPEAAAKSGIDFKSLVDGLVRRAHSRPKRAVPVALAMPS